MSLAFFTDKNILEHFFSSRSGFPEPPEVLGKIATNLELLAKLVKVFSPWRGSELLNKSFLWVFFSFTIGGVHCTILTFKSKSVLILFGRASCCSSAFRRPCCPNDALDLR